MQIWILLTIILYIISLDILSEKKTDIYCKIFQPFSKVLLFFHLIQDG